MRAPAANSTANYLLTAPNRIPPTPADPTAELRRLDPSDEDERTLLIEAQHPEFTDALRNGSDLNIGGEDVNPRLHVTMHQVVANQLLVGDPPETWQTVQRLAGLGYDWHTIMHMIASLVAEDVHRAVTERKPYDPASYARRLSKLPAGWPSPTRAR